jgi:hypothetical protein
MLHFLPCAGALDAAGIPYTPAPAGMFTWLDMRAAFGSNSGSGGSNAESAPAGGTWQDEGELWQHMLDVHRLVLTPGGWPALLLLDQCFCCC